MKVMKTFLLLSILAMLYSCSSIHAAGDGSIQGTKKEKKLGDITFEGGDGTSRVRAVIIANAKTSYKGIQAETIWLEKNHGIRNLDWRMISQDLLETKNKTYDVITIKKVASQKEVKIYFDITGFYGKL